MSVGHHGLAPMLRALLNVGCAASVLHRQRRHDIPIERRLSLHIVY